MNFTLCTLLESLSENIMLSTWTDCPMNSIDIIQALCCLPPPYAPCLRIDLTLGDGTRKFL
jgi:hypothetical protein